MEFLLMPKTQVVDHWCFLKEEINQKGEMWKENQSKIGIAESSHFRAIKKVWLTHVSAWMESDLLPKHLPETHDSLSIVIGPLP